MRVDADDIVERLRQVSIGNHHPTACLEAAAEIARLRAERDALCEQVNAAESECSRRQAMIGELALERYVRVAARAECNALRADAERYRWLRVQTWDASPVAVVMAPKENLRLGAYCPSGDSLDARIDASIDAARGSW